MGSFNLSVSGSQIDDAVINGLDKNLSKLSETGKKVLDGQWVYTDFQLESAGTWTTEGKEYDLSSYLPNDGCTYEVGFSGQASTVKGGKGFLAFIRPMHMTRSLHFFNAGFLETTSNSIYVTTNTVIVPINETRKVKFGVTFNAPAPTSLYVYCWGYRRVGTNE